MVWNRERPGSLGAPLAMVVSILVLLVACTPALPAGADPNRLRELVLGRPDSSAVTPVTAAPRTEIVASQLELPWDLAFAPDGRLFFTERPGRLRVMVNSAVQPEPVATLPVAAEGEGGLLGLALDPDFASNGYLYLMYTYWDDTGSLRNRVSRLSVRGNRAGDETTILDGIPGGSIHNGGRLRFGPDRQLYITTGETAVTQLSQDLSSLGGKILRINRDGSIPEDNPFPGSPVYSYGHRNVQGLAWHPLTGRLFASEHGPAGHDELNVIEPGRNYGWPRVAGRGGESDLVDPILDVSPSIAPSGIAFYQGNSSAWSGNLFMATLRGQHLRRIVLGGPDLTQVAHEEKLFENQFGRLRCVLLGPDGNLYLTTSNRDGRGSTGPDDDMIIRVIPPQ